MSEIGKIGVLLVFYALLFVVIRIHKKRIEPNERKAFWVLYFTPGQVLCLLRTTWVI